jgi:general secretion pathway protein G
LTGETPGSGILRILQKDDKKVFPAELRALPVSLGFHVMRSVWGEQTSWSSRPGGPGQAVSTPLSQNKESPVMKRSELRPARRQGFTLIEVLVVLAILVLLAGLVTPRVLRALGGGKEKSARIQINSLQAALDGYVLDMDDYPDTEVGLQALVEEPGDTDDSGRWDGPYLDELPRDPWGNDYQYEYPPSRGKGDRPDIWSYGKDGEDDTDDDIVSWTTEEEAMEGEIGGTDRTDRRDRRDRTSRRDYQPERD